MPLVSVVIPSYNHEKYVEECIQSVLDQTFQDFEIVIVDDGSTDGTVERIRRFTDPRIRLICLEKNRGACVAANICIEHARGEYIAMLSSDDAFLPEKLAKQVDYLNQNPLAAVVFGYARIVGENGDPLTDQEHPYYRIFQQVNRSRQEWLRRFFFDGNCLCHPSALIRRQLYHEIGCYDERMANLPDFDFWVRTCLRHEIHIIPEDLIRFRVRSGDANASGNKPEAHIRSGFEIAQVLSHYQGIANWEDFVRVFPEAAQEAGSPDSALIPFFLAKFALRIGHGTYYQHFGLATLFALLKDPQLAKQIEEGAGFSYRDLIELTGNQDVFRIQTYEDLQKERSALLRERDELTASLNRNWAWKVAKRMLGLKGTSTCLG